MLLCSVSQYTRAFWRIKKTIYYFFIGSVKLCTSMLCGPFLPVNRILVIFQIWQIELFLSFEKINTCKLLNVEKPPRGNIPPCPLTDRRHPIAGRCCVHLVPRRWKLPPVEMEMWGALWCQGIWAPYKMRSLAHVNLGWLVWMIVVWHWVWRCFQQGYGQGTKQKRWLCRGQTQGWGSCTQLDLLMASLSNHRRHSWSIRCRMKGFPKPVESLVALPSVTVRHPSSMHCWMKAIPSRHDLSRPRCHYGYKYGLRHLQKVLIGCASRGTAQRRC